MAPITSTKPDSRMPTHVRVNVEGLVSGSVALLEQISTIDKRRLDDYVGKLNKDMMGKVDHAIITSLGIKVMEGLLNNSSFVYSVNLLRMLLGMELITEEEYNKIVAISEDHYGAKIYCV